MLDFFQHIDETLFLLVNQQGSATWLDPVMVAVSSKWLWLPVYAFMLYLFYKKFNRRMWIAVLFSLVAFGLADVISTRVFKHGVKRERPFLNAKLNARLPDGPAGSKYGFVSSHAANMFALVTMFQFLMRWKRKYTFCAFAVAFLIGYSRVYLGVHYPFDVLCGALLGVLLAWFSYSVLSRIRVLKLE